MECLWGDRVKLSNCSWKIYSRKWRKIWSNFNYPQIRANNYINGILSSGEKQFSRNSLRYSQITPRNVLTLFYVVKLTVFIPMEQSRVSQYIRLWSTDDDALGQPNPNNSSRTNSLSLSRLLRAQRKRYMKLTVFPHHHRLRWHFVGSFLLHYLAFYNFFLFFHFEFTFWSTNKYCTRTRRTNRLFLITFHSWFSSLEQKENFCWTIEFNRTIIMDGVYFVENWKPFVFTAHIVKIIIKKA